MSPDGNWLAFLATNAAGATNVFLVDYGGKQAPLPLTSDGTSKKSLSFSPDSKLVAWIERSTSAGTAVAQVAGVGSGTAATVAAAVTVSSSGQYIQQAFWLPVAAGYNLVTGFSVPAAGQAADTAANLTYEQWTFGAASGAASAPASNWVTNFPAAASPMPVASNVGGVLIRQNSNPEAEQILQVGDGSASFQPRRCQ